MQKRILSFILCAVLICGLFPTTAMAMDSQAEYTGVCTHGSHEGYTELTSEYLTTHNDRLNSGKYYLSGDLNYSGSWYLDVAKNATVELCLNGHTLTFSNEYLLVLDDASLLLENGKVKFSSSAEKVIWGYNSKAVEIRNCDIDGNGTATYLVFINGDTGAQEVKITDSKLHNICDSSYAAVSMFGENPLGSLDISRTDIYDLAGSSNGIYLDCATAKISNCTLDGGGIVNSLAHISEVSNVSITKNGIGLRNDGTIDNNTSATEKLFPDDATGIVINSGNFEHSPSANLLAPNKAIVNSGITDFPYAVGEQDYTVTYELDGGICSNVITPVTIDPINHSWGDWTKISSTQHQRVCKNDASHVETENHNFDGRTCTDCGYIKPSSGGSGVITYAISVEDAENGEVSANRSSASRGTTVTLTAVPDKGYILESITVTDKNGDEVKLTKKDGKYTFTMPASKVTVVASFVKENPNTGAWENPFADVVEGAWYYDSIRYAYENGLIAGYPNGLFGINDTITRGQIATILWRVEESPVVNYAMTFEDVGAGMYYAEAIRWAASEGIVGGYTATQFGPDDAITREQLAAILWRYAQHKKCDVSVGEDTNILSYADALTVSEWAVPAMQWANGAGLIQGSDNNLMPKGNATRAQAAAILHRFCEPVTGE